MYRVIGTVIYTIIDNYICLDYMGMLQYKWSKHDIFFKDQVQWFSGLGIPEIFINIMPCHGFSKPSISTVISTCCSDLDPYYISKVFVIVETEVDGVHNIPMSIKNKTTRTLSKFFDERHVDLYNLEF